MEKKKNKFKKIKRPQASNIFFIFNLHSCNLNLYLYFCRISRTLVTENDPLGAFDLTDTVLQISQTPTTNSTSQTTYSMPTDEPILFRTSVQRSATFEGSPPAQSKLHRSETVPAASVASSLASLGSTIKINFRYVYLHFF